MLLLSSMDVFSIITDSGFCHVFDKYMLHFDFYNIVILIYLPDRSPSPINWVFSLRWSSGNLL